MADALISALMSTIIGNLNSLVLEELGFVGGLKTEFQKLESTLSTIQAVIHDAEEKKWRSEAVKNWLSKLKDAAYDARDVLEEFDIEAQRRRQQRGVKNRVRSFFSVDHNPLAFRVRMAAELKNVMLRLDNIAEEKTKFHLRERIGGDVEVVKLDWRQTGSLVNESDIYGRENERAELIGSLLSNSEALSVHAICGMGGLGKTTLAQSVYNHANVKEHFDLRIWVCVSVNDLGLNKLISAIIKNIEGQDFDFLDLDNLQRRLQQKLSGKRFLLVLDDIWDYDSKKWSRLNDVLMHGAKGSAVITTTRIQTVALKMATVGVCDLETLSDEDSWSLFQSRAFRNQRTEEEYAHFEAIGKEIVKKCGGLPLAIEAMGNLMRLKKKEDEWLSIRESKIWDLPDEGRMILPALRLSYDHLPSHIKQCFAFCSVFPKDWNMSKDMLIQLWMANGFFPSRGQMDLHDVGNEVFDELIRRSFFQDVEEHLEHCITTCKMHDLVHDLAESITTEEFRFIVPLKEFEVADNIHPLAVYMAFLRDDPHHIQAHGTTYADSHFFLKQKSLRAVACNFDKLLISSICRLKHLRYLDLSHSFIKTLPDSVCSLLNLETLDLSYCRELHMLPNRLKQLKSLVYLDITGCDSLRCMPAGMGGMTRLRKLSMFIVGKEDGHHIMELKDLNLGGQLSITNLHNVTDSVDARSANLILKKDLSSLQLSWQKYGGNNQDDNNEDVLQGLQPHSNLKKLSINLYSGTKFPSWIMDLLLPNLVNISLEDCCNCKYLPPFGKLQFLKQLEFSKMNAVVIIDDGLYGCDEVAYPSLESMVIDSMMSLEQWLVPPGRNIYPRLREFTIRSCPKLADLPVFPRVKDVRIGAREVTLLKSATNFPSLATIEITGSPVEELESLPDGVMENRKFVEELTIRSLPNLKSLSNQLDNLSALKNLTIHDCASLESLPDGLQNLNRLETLIIFGCEELYSLPVLGVSGFSSLRRLSIGGCDKLASLDEGLQHLTALEYLSVGSCPNLSSLPESVRHLTSLRTLTIYDCEALSSLPNDIGYLTSLSSLSIKKCPNLRSLPDGIRNLTRLEALAIHDCEALSSLPNEIGYLTSLSWLSIQRCPNLRSLPDEVRNLTRLEALAIYGCPYLERSCVRNGKDWVNIAQVPTIYINGVNIKAAGFSA